MKLHILGTGNGGALNCYNTCFAIENNKEYLLVDGGGGNQILNQLKLANIDITKIHHVFLSHNHTDHILGVIWVLRNVCQKMKFGGSYMGNLNIYGSDESMKVLKLLIELLFPMIKQFKDRIIFNVVNDKQSIKINDMDLTFFDIHAKKDKQFGFIIDNKLAFCGDEPLKEDLFDFAKNKEWLIHESFCLDNEEEKYKPHQKGHCTVKEASITAQTLKVQNLIILHTEDNDLKHRKKLYTSESRKYFNGNVYVPNDVDIIEI
jgi:ribonuclease Z